jgi:hypothetical protein
MLFSDKAPPRFFWWVLFFKVFIFYFGCTDDDWGALNGASETLVRGVNADAGPFGGDEDILEGSAGASSLTPPLHVNVIAPWACPP